MQVTVRSSNLQCRDVSVNCLPHWKVSDLKLHLQSVHPARPTVAEQKLIYVGKLLQDDQVLADAILNQLDEVPVFHLVCKSSERTVEESNRDNKVFQPAESVSSDGLHHRVPASGSTGNNHPSQFFLWNGLSNTDPVFSQQMTWWQQAYAEQYRNHYAHYLSSLGYSWPVTPSPTGGVSVATPAAPAPAEVPVEEHRAAAAPAGVDQADENDEGANPARDWIDWLYIGTRLAVLLGVVFYYSSLSRVLIVSFIALAVYFYQNDYPRRAQREVNNNNDPNPARQEEPAANEEHEQEEEHAPQAPNPRLANPSTLTLALNMLIGFFASIIPEVPAPEAL